MIDMIFSIILTANDEISRSVAIGWLDGFGFFYCLHNIGQPNSKRHAFSSFSAHVEYGKSMSNAEPLFP
jgi:hypothetical protein